MDQTYKPFSWKRKALDPPNNHSRVCSFHFVGGAPSSVNPFPTLNLGYDATTRIRLFSEQSTRNENRVTAESPIMEGISTQKNLPILLGGKSLITIKKKGKGVLKEESPLSSRKLFSPNIIKMKLATKLFPTINNARNVQENNTSNKEINQLTTITHHSKEIKKTNPIITTKENDSPININKKLIALRFPRICLKYAPKNLKRLQKTIISFSSPLHAILSPS